jgi:hypothetical protein
MDLWYLTYARIKNYLGRDAMIIVVIFFFPFQSGVITPKKPPRPCLAQKAKTQKELQKSHDNGVVRTNA